MFDVKCCL